MSTPAPATAPRTPLALQPDQTELTPEQYAALELIGRWDQPPPAAAQQLLLHTAYVTGLDPFRQQIRLLHRHEPVRLPSGQTEIEARWSIETSIGGFRRLGHEAAAARGLRVQTEPPLYYDDRSRDWVDAWPHDSPPVAAQRRLTVTHPDGLTTTAVGLVHYTEFVKTTVNGDPTRGWERMPRHMLVKCAEVDAWRQLFPDELDWLGLIDSPTAIDPSSPEPAGPAAQPGVTGTRDITAVLGPPSPPSSRAMHDNTGEEPAQPSEPATTTGNTRRAPRPGARRKRVSDTQTAAEAFLGDVATALTLDSAAALAWAAEKLDRPVSGPAELTTEDLDRLRAALPDPDSTS